MKTYQFTISDNLGEELRGTLIASNRKAALLQLSSLCERWVSLSHKAMGCMNLGKARLVGNNNYLVF